MPKAEAASPTYTDQQVIAATGMPVDSLRRLITWGAVRPAQAGGGRGRVRLWTTRQALRISVTAQFGAAGYSLQMAHTLAYCVPLDSTLSIYDPEMLVAIVPEERGGKWAKRTIARRLYDLLTKSEQPDWSASDGWPGEVYIVDGRYLYSDVGGKKSVLSQTAEIDPDRQRVVPYTDPGKTRVYDPIFKREFAADVSRIEISSLMIDLKYLSAKGREREKTWNAPITVNPDYLNCKSALTINLALAFIICVRKLRGLRADYHPIESPPSDPS